MLQIRRSGPRATAFKVLLALGIGLGGTITSGTSLAAASGGTATQSASQIVTSALNSLAGVHVLGLAGTLRTGRKTINLSLTSARDGSSSTGEMTSNSQQLGFVGTFLYIRVAGRSYVNGTKTFWRSAGGTSPQTRLVNAMANHWIILDGRTGAQLSGSLSQLTNPAKLGAALLASAKTAKLTKGKVTTILGRQAIPIRSSAGGTLYVAATGTPLPLELASTSAADSGVITFSYPRAITLAPPRGALSYSAVAALAAKH